MMLSGCREDPYARTVAKLSGDWGIMAADRLMLKLGEKPDADGAGAEDPKEVESESPEPPKMLLQFGSNGSLKTVTRMGRFDPPPKQGSWNLLAWDEVQQVMKIKCSMGGQTTDHEVKFLNSELIELVPPNMAGTTGKLRFQRLK